MPQPQPSCMHCKFGQFEQRHDADRDHWHCHRFPPTRHTEAWHSNYPLVYSDDWCGEFKAKTP